MSRCCAARVGDSSSVSQLFMVSTSSHHSTLATRRRAEWRSTWCSFCAAAVAAANDVTPRVPAVVERAPHGVGVGGGADLGRRLTERPVLRLRRSRVPGVGVERGRVRQLLGPRQLGVQARVGRECRATVGAQNPDRTAVARRKGRTALRVADVARDPHVARRVEHGAGPCARAASGVGRPRRPRHRRPYRRTGSA